MVSARLALKGAGGPHLTPENGDRQLMSAEQPPGAPHGSRLSCACPDASRMVGSPTAGGEFPINHRLFSSHSTVTAVIDMPIAIPENEDRIGSARSMHPIEPEADRFDAKSIVF